MSTIIFHNSEQFAPVTLDASPDDPQKTVVVLALARGGGSVVATTLHALGVYMGPKSEVASGGSFENRAMRSPNPNVWRTEIRSCNAAHDVWGFKTGYAVSVIRSHLGYLRNPHLVFVFRDSLAQAQRLVRSEPTWQESTLRQVVSYVRARQGKMLTRFFDGPNPRMAVSYERIVGRPELFVHGLAQFLGLSPTNEQWLDALQRINTRGGYIQMVEDETK